MATLNQYVYEILDDLNLNSDDSNVDKRLVIQKINSVRAHWITNEMNKRFRRVPPPIIQDLGCVAIEQAQGDELGITSETDCFWMRTVEDIPQAVVLHREPLYTRVGPKDKLKKEYNFISYERMPYAGNGRFNFNGIYAFWANNKIYLKSRNDSIVLMDTINIQGVFEEPDKAYGFNTCEGVQCWTPESDYPLYFKLWEWMKPEILRQLTGKLIMPEDQVNDGDNQEVRGQA